VDSLFSRKKLLICGVSLKGKFLTQIPMDALNYIPYFYVLVGILAVIVASIKEVKQYERGLRFTLGKFTGIMMPGWRLVIPVFQKMAKVDIRVKAVDVPDQEAITKDNISVSINAVIYYKVSNAEKAIIEVENFYYAISQLAQTTMRNAVGEVDLDTLLRNRDEIAVKIKEIVDKATDPWGIAVEAVELKDVVLPQDLKRTMAKEAEAERERRAVIIKAEGEVSASDNLAKAAKTLAESPGALHLRTLQSVNDLSSDQSNTTIWMLPIEILRSIEKIGNKMG
jgi:regulator of protease activity HflC (stomatin/prohibitin superfamily)